MLAMGWPARRQLPERALKWLRSWGMPVLLLSWLPVVGDSLCLAAGWLRLPWLPGLVLIALGKGLRYAALIWWLG